MKVMVTGGCGFLGSHVCELFAGNGDEVLSFDSMTKYELKRTGYDVAAARQYNCGALTKMGVQVVQEDVRNLAALLDWASQCDYIVHTAAQPAMTISWEDPILDCSTNVLGTVNVLEAARRHGIPAACCATIHVYGNKINDTLAEAETRYIRSPAAIDESHPTLEGNLSPLHASKMAGDIYVRTYAQVYGLKAASFRLTGIYGPRQFGGEDHGWVANFAIRAVTGRPLTIFGTGKQLRDILFVQDAAEAFRCFYENQVPGSYNIGGGEAFSISLLECIRVIGEVCGHNLRVIHENERYGDLRYFVCDITRAREYLKWQPTVSPRQGVRKLVQWVQDNVFLFMDGE